MMAAEILIAIFWGALIYLWAHPGWFGFKHKPYNWRKDGIDEEDRNR